MLPAVVEVLIVVALVAWGLVLPIVAVASCFRLEPHAWSRAGRSRAGTVVGILLSCGLGAVYYFVSIRPAVQAELDDIAA